MIRMSAGKFRGRKVPSPPTSLAIRPTTSLMRESFFSRFQHRIGNARFLDLFAGSGIMGLEALSRGAVCLLAVEMRPVQRRTIQSLLLEWGVPQDEARTLCGDVLKITGKPCREAPFDIVFLDPPYGKVDLPPLIEAIQQNGWLAPDGLLVVEHGIRDAELPGMPRYVYGDSVFSVLDKSQIN